MGIDHILKRLFTRDHAVELIVFGALLLACIIVLRSVEHRNTIATAGDQSYAAPNNSTLPPGSLSNTFTSYGSIYPDMPAPYHLLYGGPFLLYDVTHPKYEADTSGENYITSENATQVLDDVLAVCQQHQFKFLPSGGTNTVVECDSESAGWTFDIYAASAIMDQPWYKMNSLSEQMLSQSVWLLVTPNQRFATDG